MLALHGLLVLVLVGTGLLGWWQFDAWRTQQADDAAERLQRAEIALTGTLGPDEPLTREDVGIPVVAEGRYAPADEQFLVRRGNAAGTDGYWVLSPLRVATTGSSLLVVRGWTPQPTPLPPVPTGPVRVTGVLQPGEEGSGAVAADRTVDAVRIPALVGEAGVDLYSAYLLRTGVYPDDPATALKAVPPDPASPSWSAGLRNLAYAAQWWVFGVFGVVMWWRMCVDRLAAVRRDAAEVARVASPT